jgi:hypothetical protein
MPERRRRLLPLPAQRPGTGINDWRHAVRRFLNNVSVWGEAAGWPTDWTNLRGKARCARCGTTRFDAPPVNSTTVPACEPCQRIIDQIIAEGS